MKFLAPPPPPPPPPRHSKPGEEQKEDASDRVDYLDTSPGKGPYKETPPSNCGIAQEVRKEDDTLPRNEDGDISHNGKGPDGESKPDHFGPPCEAGWGEGSEKRYQGKMI